MNLKYILYLPQGNAYLALDKMPTEAELKFGAQEKMVKGTHKVEEAGRYSLADIALLFKYGMIGVVIPVAEEVPEKPKVNLILP